MIDALLKIALIIVFVFIFIQDFKSRLVYWFLYPLLGILCFFIQTTHNSLYSTLINSVINLVFVVLILITSYGYSWFKLQKHFLKEVFGIGDVLFFLAICFSFSTGSFLILFVFALFFSLILHFFMKQRDKEKTVPLAGYMSLFFGVVYIISFICDGAFLYAY
jgi:hypothetical protein